MGTSRFSKTDRQWEKMEPHCIGLKAHLGRTGGDARFMDWARAVVFDRIFNILSDDPNMLMAMANATIVKVYRSGYGSKGVLSVALQARFILFLLLTGLKSRTTSQIRFDVQNLALRLSQFVVATFQFRILAVTLSLPNTHFQLEPLHHIDQQGCDFPERFAPNCSHMP